jgi:hypothetical protein
MSIGGQVGSGGGGAPGWRWARALVRRPAGIRNGGLLLVLVALAAVMALVDQPPQPGVGRRLPGIFQYLPPPIGIAQTPPVVDQPLPAAGPTAAPAGDGERPVSVDRAHPGSAHPPALAAGAGADRASGTGTSSGPGRDQGGSGGTRPPVTRPPAVTPPVAASPAARVRVPAVSARVKPPVVLGRELPEVQVRTPGANADVPVGLTALS